MKNIINILSMTVFLISAMTLGVYIHDKLNTIMSNIYTGVDEFPYPTFCNKSDNVEKCVNKSKKHFQSTKNSEYRLEHYESISKGIIVFCAILGIGINIYSIIKKKKSFISIICAILLLINMGIMLLF